ncbi:MAG: helix-turn-helix domain-containing protein, partial [Microcoleus sp. T1-bin1]|nr:helix-turn-helix domain-containing protein [Microcoleus sp. T1-bin1]
MLHKAIQVRLYSTQNQKIQLAPTFGGAGWSWNYNLNKLIEVYKKTGKKLGCWVLNTLLLGLKISERSAGLGECYSQVGQANTLKLTTAYKNFIEQSAGFTEFKFQHKKQS